MGTTEEKDANSTKDNKRKTSCAQQARCEGLPSSDAVNLSIDILTDYLDEAILFPKKLSYMAELMYTQCEHFYVNLPKFKRKEKPIESKKLLKDVFMRHCNKRRLIATAIDSNHLPFGTVKSGLTN